MVFAIKHALFRFIALILIFCPPYSELISEQINWFRVWQGKLYFVHITGTNQFQFMRLKDFNTFLDIVGFKYNVRRFFIH